ncbi:MAG TPA: hypothetical protein PKV21_06905 [bacterium]|nr:hypothetical protein [bacterium]HOM27218.1 hypothetical protein [bacterium]
MTCWFFDRGGNSLKDAVIIYADSFVERIGIIFDYLSLKHGKIGSDWRVFSIQRIRDKDRNYEIWSIEIYKERKIKEIKTYYFEISGVKNSKKTETFFKFLS